jgi:Coenzyme PQQ synthesis protein D (PqqD)
MTETLRVPDYVQFNRVEGDIVLVDLRKGLYYSLDDLASRIWETLSSGGSTALAVEVILAEYDAIERTVKKDVSELVQLWKRKGLLIPA